MMVKKLTRIGSSLGLVIEKPILELLGIDRDTPLEVRTDGDSLIVRPMRTADRDDVLRAAKRVMDVHAKTLKKLAK
jgi:antitoxin component of MazEF toxin-antitoxin module